MPKSVGGHPLKSAFDDEEQYQLTALGSQFVHYAMQEITAKLEFYEAEPPDLETSDA